MSKSSLNLLGIIEEALDVYIPPSYEIHQEYRHIFSPDFIKYIQHVENGIRKGWNQKLNRWLPHKSFEGGPDTIAYGHKIHKNENFSKGITEEQAIKILNEDLNRARNKARSDVDKKFGFGTFSTLPFHSQEMLTDFAFNLGSLDKFPEFVKGVIFQNRQKITAEYKRYSGGKELTNRNNEFFKRYLITRR